MKLLQCIQRRVCPQENHSIKQIEIRTKNDENNQVSLEIGGLNLQ